MHIDIHMHVDIYTCTAFMPRCRKATLMLFILIPVCIVLRPTKILVLKKSLKGKAAEAHIAASTRAPVSAASELPVDLSARSLGPCLLRRCLSMDVS